MDFDVHPFTEYAAVGRAALSRADPARAVGVFDAALGLWRGRALLNLLAWHAPDTIPLDRLLTANTDHLKRPEPVDTTKCSCAPPSECAWRIVPSRRGISSVSPLLLASSRTVRVASWATRPSKPMSACRNQCPDNNQRQWPSTSPDLAPACTSCAMKPGDNSSSTRTAARVQDKWVSGRIPQSMRSPSITGIGAGLEQLLITRPSWRYQKAAARGIGGT